MNKAKKPFGRKELFERKQQSSVQITLKYKTVTNPDWLFLDLAPQEYFDLEPEEEVEIDSIPEYNHAIDYLALDSREIDTTVLILTDEEQETRRAITETFWNHGQNRLIERVDSGTNPYWEMILEVQTGQTPPTWEVLRVCREDGAMKPIYHAFIRDNHDGSQIETRIR
ncbi:MAG: hypothetical protein ACPGWR_16515 [Ardenticatenaceae bacterium]